MLARAKCNEVVVRLGQAGENSAKSAGERGALVSGRPTRLECARNVHSHCIRVERAAKVSEMRIVHSSFESGCECSRHMRGSRRNRAFDGVHEGG